MRAGLVTKLISVLDSVLSKLGRYDEGNLIGSFLTFTASQWSSCSAGSLYVTLFYCNSEQARHDGERQRPRQAVHELRQGQHGPGRQEDNRRSVGAQRHGGEGESRWSSFCHILNSSSVSFQRWYTEQVQVLCTWLTDRLDRALHPYQCTCLAHIVKVGRLLTFNIYQQQLRFCPKPPILCLQF
jgi:hypothetical protein